MGTRDHHAVEINGLGRELPLFEVAPGTRIAVFNLLGDTEVVEAAAAGLAERLAGVDPDVLVTAETKSVPLVYELARRLGKPWVVLRKAYKPYMGEVLSAETHSITTGAPQTLYLDEKDRGFVTGRRVALVDDVISTGSTVEGMREVVGAAGGEIVAEAAVFTEGDAPTDGVIALGHLPLFTGEVPFA
jgi:adenine/guanine phosphoribosyltransferase-like PRPP-binding protein